MIIWGITLRLIVWVRFYLNLCSPLFCIEHYVRTVKGQSQAGNTKQAHYCLQHHCIGSEKGAPLSQSEVVLLVFMWKHTQHCELLLRESKVSNQCPALCSSKLWWRRCQMKAPSLWPAQLTTHSVILYMGDFAATLLNSQNATRKRLPRGWSVHDIHRKWLTCRAWRSGLRTQQKRPTCTFSSEKNLCSRVKIPGWRDIAVHRQH